jgi:hypothetical protein
MGRWEAEDHFEVTGYSEEEQFTEYYVASNKEIVRAHFLYWAQHRGGKENPVKLVSIENLGRANIILEMK